MGDSVIRRHELMELYDEETKIASINFNEKKRPVKRKNSIFYLYFY